MKQLQERACWLFVCQGVVRIEGKGALFRESWSKLVNDLSKLVRIGHNWSKYRFLVIAAQMTNNQRLIC